MTNGIHTHICHHVRESVTLLALRVFVPIFLLETIFGILLWVLFTGQINSTSFLAENLSLHFTFAIILISHLIVTIYLIILLVRLIISWAMTEYYLTEKELIILHGIMKQHESIYDLSHTRTIKLHQSWLGKIFNYGSIEVTLAGSGYHETAWLRGIIEPKQYEELLRQHILEREGK